MTGIYQLILRPSAKHPKDVELPQEILDDLEEWWNTANQGDEFVIRCELPT